MDKADRCLSDGMSDQWSFKGVGWNQPLNSNWAFLPSTGEWKKKNPMPTPRGFGLGVCALNGEIYTIGGWDGKNLESATENERYDPQTDQWTEMAPMHTGRIGLAVVVSQGVIYAVGGTLDPSTPHYSVEVYDPERNEWHFAAPMHHERFGIVAAGLGSRIVAFGGTNSNRNPSAGFVEVYDNENDRWDILEDIYTPTQWGTACSDGIRIFIMGGKDRCKMTYPDEASILNTVYSLSILGKHP